MRILISGSSGLIGTELKGFLKERGHEVVFLSRSPGNEHIYWNPEREEIEREKLKGFDALIHLAGENIGKGRWSSKKKKKIFSSRVDATRFLVETLIEEEALPQHFLSASAVGYYGDHADHLCTEESSPGNSFLSFVVQEWERASQPLKGFGVRLVHMRFGMVITPKGGALKRMLLPFKLGFGGQIGPGSQFISWIALPDLMQAILFILDHKEIEGAVNLTSPHPLTNSEFTKILATACHRPQGPPMPSFFVRFIFGEKGDALFLGSTRAYPKKLLSRHFHFRYPELHEALYRK